MNVDALATMGPGEPFQHVTIRRREVGARDVLVAIAYCGVCHSDVSYARNEWGRTAYPLVPGHEIAGVVVEIGAEVTRFKPGARVGVGCLVRTCGSCANCRAGYEQHCLGQRVSTYSSRDVDGSMTDGGYSQFIVVDEAFVVAIPDSLSLQAAAPLLCAGITTYSPLKRWRVAVGSRVGIVGLGGLGHVAVQLARAMGSLVTVFDLDPSKASDAVRLGATAFVDARDAAALWERAGTLDLILCTVPANLDLDQYLALLDVSGTFVIIGVPSERLSVGAFSLIANQRSIAGSRIGSLAETQQMLEFCAEHKIVAEVELVTAADIEATFYRLKAGDVRFRFVLDVGSVGSPQRPDGQI